MRTEKIFLPVLPVKNTELTPALPLSGRLRRPVREIRKKPRQGCPAKEILPQALHVLLFRKIAYASPNFFSIAFRIRSTLSSIVCFEVSIVTSGSSGAS